MSHAAPPPPPPQGPEDGVWTIHPQEPPAPKRSKAPLIIAMSTAVALIAGGGAFAFVQADPFNLFDSGPQPAEALPSNAIAYAAIDLDPAATQKIDAIRFLDHFPGFSDAVDLSSERDDVREDLLTEALQEWDCSGVSYDKTIEPWLGHKLAVALLPGEAAEPAPVLAIEVTDAGAADAGLKDLNDCGGADQGVGFAFSGDYVIVAETDGIADAAVADAQDSALSDDADFKADMSSLGELGIATGWMDVASLGDLAASSATLGAEEVEPLSQVVGRYAATFRFDHDRVELVSSVFGDYDDIDTGLSNPIVDLPESTAFALSASGGSKQLDANWNKLIESAEGGGVDVEQELEYFERETGFAVPDDLKTLLGDNLLMAIDSAGLSAEVIEAGDLGRANAGIRFTGDAAELQALYDRLVTFAGSSFGVELPVSKVDFEDGLVIASNDDYAQTLADLDGNLGDSSTFRSVVDDPASQDAVMYLDFDAIEDVVVDAMKSGGASADDIANVEPLRAFGVSGGYDDGYITSTVRLSVND